MKENISKFDYTKIKNPAREKNTKVKKQMAN